MSKYIDVDVIAKKWKPIIETESFAGNVVASCLKELYEQTTITVPKWISVKDRLPEETCRVLCYSESGEIFDAEYDSVIDDDFPIGYWEQFYDRNTLGWVGEEWKPCDSVTHWMPLPELPEEEYE